MNKTEIIFASSFLALACPLLMFVAFWWSSAAVSMYIAAIPEYVIPITAFAGLGVGVLADMVYLKRWLARFYTIHWAWGMVVYFGLTIIALAFFMGLPIGTFTVGVMGGVYLGRRLHYGHAEKSEALILLNKVALGAASLTTGLALIIGLLALHEPIIVQAAGLVGLEPDTVNGPIGKAGMGFICLAIFIMQYYVTRAVGRLAYGLHHCGSRDDRGGAIILPSTVPPGV